MIISVTAQPFCRTQRAGRNGDWAEYAAALVSGVHLLSYFLNQIERMVQKGKKIHAIVDNYAAHKFDSTFAKDARIIR